MLSGISGERHQVSLAGASRHRDVITALVSSLDYLRYEHKSTGRSSRILFAGRFGAQNLGGSVPESEDSDVVVLAKSLSSLCDLFG